MEVAAEALGVVFKSPPEWACGIDTLLLRTHYADTYETIREVLAIQPLDEQGGGTLFWLAFHAVTTWYEDVSVYETPQGFEGDHRAPYRG